MSDNSSNNSFASVRVYDSEGQMVTFSWGIPAEIADFNDELAQKTHAAIATLRRNGFNANPPDISKDEEKFECWYVIKRGKINDDDSETPIIDMFAKNEKMIHKFFSHYLNTPEDVAAFEAATGLKLENIKMFDGTAQIPKDNGKWRQYAVECPKHPDVALTPNPYYNPEEPDVKKRKPRFKFARWLSADPKASGETQAGTGGQSGSASGQSGDSGKKTTGAQPHWAALDANRKRIVDAMSEAGVKTKEAMVAAMQIVETGVTRLSESKAASVEEYLKWFDERYVPKFGRSTGKTDLSKNNPYGYEPGETFVDENGSIHIIQADGTDFVEDPVPDDGGSSEDDPLWEEDDAPESYDWTSDEQKRFTAEILKLYPGLDEVTLFEELAVTKWISHPNFERQQVAAVAREEGWKVLCNRVGYHDGGSKENSFFIFYTPIGEIQYWKGATEFTKMVTGTWARPNKVSEWRTLKAPKEIEPLVLTWEAKKRESDGSEYLVVTHAQTDTEKLDRALEGDLPPS